MLLEEMHLSVSVTSCLFVFFDMVFLVASIFSWARVEHGIGSFHLVEC